MTPKSVQGSVADSPQRLKAVAVPGPLSGGSLQPSFLSADCVLGFSHEAISVPSSTAQRLSSLLVLVPA